MYNRGRIMLGNLRALFGVIIDIALLRRGPDSLPTSTALMAGTIAFYIAVSAIVISMLPSAPPTWPLELAVGTIVTLLCFKYVMRITQKSERFVQSMTGLFAVSALFVPVLTPMFSSLMPYLQKQDPQPQLPLLHFLATMILFVWLVVVQVRIVRSTFEWPIFASIAFLIGQNLLGMVVFLLLFGIPSKAP